MLNGDTSRPIRGSGQIENKGVCKYSIPVFRDHAREVIKRSLTAAGLYLQVVLG